MSFFGKFKHGGSSTDHSKAANLAPAKKDPHAAVPTPLEKHLADLTGPVRLDGSDKYFGFENYGSTCYCNSIIQCLYYSAPFREHVVNFPPSAVLDQIRASQPNGTASSPRQTNVSTTPYPNPTSPARKPKPPISPGPAGARPELDKDHPDVRKAALLAAGPVLDMQYDNSWNYGMDESLFTSLRDIFEAVVKHQSRIGVVSPHRFLEILRRDNEMFRSAMHQDAHEFLNLLLNQVVDNVEMFAKQHPTILAQPHENGSAPDVTDLARTKTPSSAAATIDTHWVHDLFEGVLTSETRCLTCENTSQRDEAFLDLSVDLEAHSSVTSCLRKFSEEEMLCERNKFHCDNCGGLQEAEKRMKIKRLPQILALHLKRFKYTEDLQRLQKLFHRVVYPFYLRLFNTTDDAGDPDRLYELYAVVVHIGGGPYHGHYVTIVKTEDRGWLLFDDELVEPVSRDYVQQFFGGEPVPGVQDAKQLACAYVLFYQETTMEKMLREQAMEGQPAQASTRASADVDANRDSTSLPSKANGLQHTTTNIPAPIMEDVTMDPLAHARTAPNISHAVLDPQTTTPPPPPLPASVLPMKSKKGLKQEEKDRKLAEKAAAKEKEIKYREASAKRIEAYKKQEEDMKRVIEESKQTAAAEAQIRGNDAHAIHDKEEKRESSFVRLSRRSMSLRKKPNLFEKKEKSAPVAGTANGLLPLPQGHTPDNLHSAPSSNGVTNGARDEFSSEDRSYTTSAAHDPNSLPSSPPPQRVQTAAHHEEKTRKHRFSLGRKKSSLI